MEKEAPKTTNNTKFRFEVDLGTEIKGVHFKRLLEMDAETKLLNTVKYSPLFYIKMLD
jgi:hypothetical protein